MRAMKDSGIEWIGEIPQDWVTKKLKYCIDLRLEKTTDKASSAPYIGLEHVSSYTGTLCEDYKAITDFNGDTLDFFEGDVLFGKLRPYLTKAYQAECDGRCSSEFWVMNPTGIEGRYLLYYVLSHGFISDIDHSTFGVKMPRAEWDYAGNEKMPLPSQEEQLRIVTFLDTKCAEIDALIAAKEKTNALLKERRQSIIYEAVTKGLDPTAPMKDSGVEWIGEIPEGWSVCRIKRVAGIVTGNTPSKTSGDMNYSDDGLMWVKPDNLLGNAPVLDTSERLSDDGCLLARVVPANTPLTCCIGTIGKVGYSEEAVAFNQQINAIWFDESVDTRFGLYCLIAQDEQQKCFANGNVLKILNAEAQGRLYIAIPSLSEQKVIAKHLDTQCQMIDENCATNNITIQKLKEYRQSLIYEAVTGKIEV